MSRTAITARQPQRLNDPPDCPARLVAWICPSVTAAGLVDVTDPSERGQGMLEFGAGLFGVDAGLITQCNGSPRRAGGKDTLIRIRPMVVSMIVRSKRSADQFNVTARTTTSLTG